MEDKICPFYQGTSVLSMSTLCSEEQCALWDDGDHACSLYLAARATLDMRQSLDNIDSLLRRLPCNKK